MSCKAIAVMTASFISYFVGHVAAQGLMLKIGDNDPGGCTTYGDTFAASRDHDSGGTGLVKMFLVGGRTKSQAVFTSGRNIKTCLPRDVAFVAQYSVTSSTAATYTKHLMFN